MNRDQPVTLPSNNSQPENTSLSAGHEWNNGITRRSFLKRTGGATLGAMIVLHHASVGSAFAAGVPTSGKSAKKVVVRKRIWTVSGDGVSGVGSGMDRDTATHNADYMIAKAEAVKALLNDLENNGHVTKTLVTEEKVWVPIDWVLKEVYLTAEGENPPGPLVITDEQPIIHEPVSPSPYGAIEIQLHGSLSATNATLTMRNDWGPP